MTIELYSGTPGSGKSYNATRQLRNYLKYKKLPVICNYPLQSVPNRWLFHYVPNAELSPAFLVEFARDWWAQPGHEFGEDRILLVIDECQLLFNSREWQDKARMSWLEFYSQHRHYGYHIVFIAQFDKMVDRQIRALIEHEYVHRKLANLGRVGWIVSKLCGGLFICVKRYYPLNQKLYSEFFRCSRRVTAMYDSYGTVFSRQGGEGAAGDGGERREGAAGGSLRRGAPSPLPLPARTQKTA